MIPHPVYIAAPFGASDAMGIAWNIARAGLLARLAVLDGLAPILVHPSIPMIYGEDTDANRAIGLERNAALVSLVGRTTMGRLWILENDPGSTRPGVQAFGDLSPGVRDELVAWARARGNSTSGVSRATWSGWETRARLRGLGAPWAALTGRPEDLADSTGAQDQVARLRAAGVL